MTETTDDLVKRLRYGLIEYPKRWSGDTHSDMGGSVDYDKTYALLDEAANRIEALEAKLAKAVKERDDALNQLDSARHSVDVLEKRVKTFCDGWGVADKGRIEAETNLAKALEGFEKLACLGNGDRYGNSDGNVIAQRYIAELTGGKDD